MMTFPIELLNRQNLTRAGIALVALTAIATQVPKALERHGAISGQRQHLQDVASQNSRMEQERELANSRYEKGCRILRDHQNPALWATFNASTRAVAGTNGLPLALDRCVADGAGTTGIVGPDGYLHSMAGNASPEVVAAAIDKQLNSPSYSVEAAINE
jgi:hypothetical protein